MKTQCPNCKARFNVDDKFAGKQAKCPKCAKPFTIEPFVETPVVVEPPATSPKPAVSPVKSPEPIAPPPKIAKPTAPPAKSPGPVETPAKKAEPVVPPAKIASPAAPPVKSPEPVKPPAKIAEPVKEEKPEPKTVSKTLSKTVFVYCWMAVRIIAGVLGGLGLMLAIRKETHSTLIMTFAAADVFLVCSVAIELMLFYKMWAAIADNQASITPTKAVAFLFVPVFNIYWALCMLTGFAEDYNSFIQRRSIKTKDLPFTLFFIYAFVFILSATVVTFPMICVFVFIGLINRAFVGYPESAWALFAFVAAAGVGHFITYILFAIKICNTINALPESQSR